MTRLIRVLVVKLLRRWHSSCKKWVIISSSYLYHTPSQIAALGSSHYKVEKEETAEGTRSHMRELTQEQRMTEIAQMLSGADISDAALQNARELLELSKKKK